LQRKARDDEIERAVAKRKGLLVGDDVQPHGRCRILRTPLPDPPLGSLLPLPNPPRQAGRGREGADHRIEGDHRTYRTVAPKRCPHRVSGGAEINRDAESAQHSPGPDTEFVPSTSEEDTPVTP